MNYDNTRFDHKQFFITDEIAMLEYDRHINKNKTHQIHTMLSDDLLSSVQQGKARQTSVLVNDCDYIPLDNAIMLKSEFDRLLTTSETIVNPYGKAIYLYNNIAYLQYFIDINKSRAKTVLNLSLMCDDKIAVIPNESLMLIYLGGIFDCHNSGETLKLKEFFLQSYLWVHKQTKGKI